MKLERLKLRNFRCYEDEICIEFDAIAVLLGRNDAGKSSLLDALNIFFEGESAPDKDDVPVRSDDAQIYISCAFSKVPSQVVLDIQHPTDLASEYLLNSEGFLEITKVYDCSLSKPKLSKIFACAVHPTTAKYNDLLSLTNRDLKQRASYLGVNLESVNQTVNTAIRRAIWSHGEVLNEQGTEVELLKADGANVWEQVKKSLPVYALFKSDRTSTDQDAEAQDPMKTAIKEAIKSQEDALNLIASRVKDEVQEIADRTVGKIKEMNPELANQLTPRVTNKKWDTLFSVNLTGDEDIPINKRGSGTRRLFLLNFFRAKAEKEAEGNDRGVIYAIEEPETSQHPHNQIILVKALEDLAERTECQVLVSTHSPALARRFSQNTLRLVDKTGAYPVILHGREDATIKKIVKSLGVLPDHNVRAFFGVEGKNDIAFLITISKILHQAGEAIPDLAQEESSGRLVFVPLGGSNLDLWVSRFQKFNLPEFYLIDRDSAPTDRPKNEHLAQEMHARENCTVWITKQREIENYIHPEAIRECYPDYSGIGDGSEDVPELLAKAIHDISESNATWEVMKADQEKAGRKISNAKRKLCNEIAARMTPDLLSRIDHEGEVRSWLKRIAVVLQPSFD